MRRSGYSGASKWSDSAEIQVCKRLQTGIAQSAYSAERESGACATAWPGGAAPHDATAGRGGASPPGGGEETWPLGVGFGLGAALAGFTWTPLPVLRDGSVRAHWSAPVALVCVAVPLVVVSAWLQVPLTRAVAASALIMAASLLTPVKPVDGGAIAAAGGATAGLAAAGLAGLVLLGLV
jgi:hypothetical protein